MARKGAEEDERLARIASATEAVAVDITGETHLLPKVPDPSEVRIYIVERGDTLGKIAQKFYGDPNKAKVILDANRDLVDENDRIYVGQELRIPEVE